MSVLEFIAALKWPVTVLILAGFAAYLLRAPGTRAGVGAWMRERDLRVRVGTAGLDATLAATAGNMGTAATTDEELAASLQEALAPGAEAELAQYRAPTADELGMVRREAVEAVMRSAAEWGWDMARRGRRTLPDLYVEWNEQGQPEISMLVREVGTVAPPDLFAPAHEEMQRRFTRAAEREWVRRLQESGPTGPVPSDPES